MDNEITPRSNKPVAMKRSILLLTLLASLLGTVTGVRAQGYWRDVPPEERRQMRQQMREHWQQLPPDRQHALREERRERREGFQQMPPEDRMRLRDDIRGRHGERRGPR